MGSASLEKEALGKLSRAKYIEWPTKNKLINESVDPKLLKRYHSLLYKVFPAYLSEQFEMEEIDYRTHEENQAEALAELRRSNAELRSYIQGHLPHREFFRVALLFSIFFSGTLAAQTILRTPLISPVLAWIGVGMSAFGAFLSWLARFDWEKWLRGKP